MNSTRIKMTPMIKDKMVEIPKGTIELRDDRTKEKWTVEIESFLLFKFPVTQDFYFEITNENPSTFKGDLRPVETVTFKDAVEGFPFLVQFKSRIFYSFSKNQLNLRSGRSVAKA